MFTVRKADHTLIPVRARGVDPQLCTAYVLFAASDASQICGQFLLSVNFFGACFVPLSHKAIHSLVLSKACHPDSSKSRKRQPTGVCNWHMEADLVSEVSNC